jgi:hypothetical protein
MPAIKRIFYNLFAMMKLNRLNNLLIKGIMSVSVILFSVDAWTQETRYSTCTDCWTADSLGNHRAIVQFSGDGNVAKAIIPWRRRDKDPQSRRIIVSDEKTGQKINNVKTGIINREYGEIYFEPVSGKGRYFIYYMPYKNEGRSNYPKGVYLKPEATASAAWLNLIRDDSVLNTSLPNGADGIKATVTEIQAIDSFNTFFPMEVIATAKETAELHERYSDKAFLVFPEYREFPSRMIHDLPYRWVKKGLESSFSIESAKGEYFAYQLGVYALRDLEDVQVNFTNLESGDRKFVISKKNISCLNTDGLTYDNKTLINKIAVAKGTVQALWCGIEVPQNATPGVYTGKATIKAKGLPPVEIGISLTVTSKLLTDGGISEPWKMTRLKWLNSDLAQENTVISPYSPLKVNGKTISMLGRKLELGLDGFPKRIQAFFTPEMTGYTSVAKNILAQPMQWIAETSEGKKVSWRNSGVKFTTVQAGTVRWTSTNNSDILKMDVNATLEFDGSLAYEVKLTALKDVSLNNTFLQIPIHQSAAKYMMGLGQKGGYRPGSFNWKWDVAHKNQDGAWIGDVNAGLQYSLRDEKYIRPLNTNFYLQKPLLLPSSWGNSDKGGIDIREEGNIVWVKNYSGDRTMKKGDVLYYNFTMLITPFHPINTDFQWANRFYHRYKDIDTIKAAGATVINIHHATEINPWINYPFIEYKKMKSYIDEAHSKGLKVKIYNTIRELSNHAYETFALRSLGHEIYSPGKGGGFSWLQEHIDSDYIAAWFVPTIKDAAIVNSGMSRWHNYYVEGMNWLVNNVGIDGIYLDDVAFDRVTMKRIKRVLTQNNHPGIIDLHSANQYNKNDGFNNSANLYMEHFPYLNRLWFGEYFDYEKSPPDFFLTEVSGIPFGLMGEMLEGGGNPWRGLIYGMTNRMPWSENADPRPIWKIWDEFGMKGTAMIGYWSQNCPVKTGDEKVLATVYKKKGSAMISIASWADTDVDVALEIKWEKLGIDPAKAVVVVPDIKNFQSTRAINIDKGMIDKLHIEKGKGLLLIVKQGK